MAVNVPPSGRLADDIKHERRVALKVLNPELAAVVGAAQFPGRDQDDRELLAALAGGARSVPGLAPISTENQFYASDQEAP